MSRAFRGLYGNRMIQFGNKKSFAENKTRRTWKPNVHRVSLYSEAMNGVYQFRITSHALRDVRKFGGLDEYLLRTKDSEIKYPVALRLKQCVKIIRATASLPEDTAMPNLAVPIDETTAVASSIEESLKQKQPGISEPAGLQQIL